MEPFSPKIKGAAHLASLADVDEVVKNLTRLLHKSVRSGWVAAYLLDRERRAFGTCLKCELPERYAPLLDTMPLPLDKVRRLFRKNRHLFLDDQSVRNLLPETFDKMLQRLRLLLVPMMVRNQVMGVLLIARSRRLPSFSADELGFVRDMVSHAALVVSHMRLFDESLDMAVEMAKGIDIILTIDEINKAISSSLSRDKIIETAMQSIERIVRCEVAALFQEDRKGLHVISSHAYGPEIPPELMAGARPGNGSSAVCTAFRSGKSHYIPSTSQTRHMGILDRALSQAGMQSLLAIPLIGRGESKGVLLLAHRKSEQFGGEATFAIEKVAAQMAVALENAKLYEDMRSLFISTISSLTNVIDAKSPWTKGHSERVMHIASSIAKEMGLPEAVVERVRLGGLLHDIGKIGIMEALLEKPEVLSEDEFPPLRLHPEKGVAILAPIEQLQDVLSAILYHHERYDGTGYPKGLKGEDIPLEARIVTVADSFDAMVEDRPYHKALTVQEALEELGKNAGTQFDPVVVERFTTYVRRKLTGAS
ncbi:HD domain-containing phosphohydrolase [Geobacter sp. DSM 9736]|uniref:HD domain-containing phosphohydrolase n=1 Tax=Geobacter sp. DSM 9736 TaxID=1277350 RepID=UPI000B4FEC7F|nr:HD domain-containing phosphohydrolase [Geobacter sp. DSM 9736]SNB46702.1 HDIG domain-containing protein [Geobacter sp. DSM 9736]